MLFNYAQAFDRNIGWVTEAEQAALRTRRVAVAGLGGVGGVHVQTLARLGIGAFTLADFDRFDIANFNRQAGATLDTLGRPKLDVLAEMSRAINPELDLRLFPEGVTPGNLDLFLADVDVFVDGLDFFALDIRRLVFARCAELGIPAITAAPIGLGTGVLVFNPGSMTFEQYFRLEGQPEHEQYLRFLMGMAPRGLHRAYLVDPSRVSLEERRGPSTAPACQLCAGVAATIALKLLLHRGGVEAAPVHHHYDAYQGRLVKTRLRQGNADPVQRIRLAVARRMLGKPAVPAKMPNTPTTPLLAVLQLSRWAPSGDNAQPWRFEVLGPDTAIIHYRAAAHGDVYDYRNGEPTTAAAGMLLETLRIAAAEDQFTLDWTLLDQDRIRITLYPDRDVQPSPLHPYVTVRSVNRRPYLTRSLRPHEVAQLEVSLGDEWRVVWHVAPSVRLRIARLGATATGIRLRAAETFGVHQRVIDWQSRDSTTAIPGGAVGLDPVTLRLMRWALRRWDRVRWLNRLTGTSAIAAQLDYRPGLMSAAFFSIQGAAPLPEAGQARTLALLRLGERLQRFWLTATRLGLAMQPNYATMIFAYYGEHGIPFTADKGLQRRAVRLDRSFRRVLGASPSDVLFLGRIGEPGRHGERGRSVRRSLDDLILMPPQGASAEPATTSHPV